jgi:hypothetical protein
MRRVMVREYVRQTDGKMKLQDKGEADFHQFGCDFEEFEGGPGNYTTAIVEWPDGSMANVPVGFIRFLDHQA